MNKRIVYLALPALLVTSVAKADLVVQLDSYGFGSHEQVAVNHQYAWDTYTGMELFYNLRTSEHLWYGADTGETYLTHCIQIYRGVDMGGVYAFDVVDIEDAPNSPPWPGQMEEARADILRDLYSRWIDPSRGGVYAGDGADDRASAFQLVVWEITHENFSATTAEGMLAQISLEMGAIQWESSGGGVGDYAFDMISTLGEGGFQYSDLDGWTNEFAQDQSMYVPAPAAISLLGLGCGGILRRRRN